MSDEPNNSEPDRRPLATRKLRISQIVAKKVAANPIATSPSAYLVTLKAMIWAVMVVPTFAPMMMPMDWDSDIRPAVMNPTTSTVVTEEDWITAVTKAPVMAPIRRLLVSRERIDFMRSPATALSDSDICSIPNRNRASPPNNPISSMETFSVPDDSPVSAARTKKIGIWSINMAMPSPTPWELPSAPDWIRR